MRSWIVIGLLCFAGIAKAGDFRPFDMTSRPAIERSNHGQPFVLAFWSVDCSYCLEELQHLRRMAESHPRIGLVLVNVDDAELAPAAGAVLDQAMKNVRAERWMFVPGNVEHLRFAVDRKWRGELPRAYFYDAAGRSHAMTGRLDGQWLERWAAAVSQAIMP